MKIKIIFSPLKVLHLSFFVLFFTIAAELYGDESSLVFAQESERVRVDSIKTTNANLPNAPQVEEGDVKITDGTNTLIRITDEGTFGAIEIKTGVPSTPTDKLYNDGGTLKFDGASLGGGSGATEIDDLTDAKYENQSLFLGNSAGASNAGAYGNIGIGFQALFNNTSNGQNVSVGRAASYSNTSGTSNVAIGAEANRYNKTGSRNTMIGYHAGIGASGVNMSGNVFIGADAGNDETSSNKLYIENSSSLLPLIWGDFTDGSEVVKINGDFHVTGDITKDGTSAIVTEIDDLSDAKYENQSLFLGEFSGQLGTGSNNTAVGYAALNSGVGTENTALGWKALQQVTGANYCTAVGSNALLTESGNYNTAVGYAALSAGTSTGTNNVAIGSNALVGYANPISYNTAVGDLALNANQDDANTAIGYSALTANTTGTQNTSVGFKSQLKNQTGTRNTSIGNFSGNDNVSGESNVFIGYQAGYFETGSNKLYIESSSSSLPLIWGDFTGGSEKVKINGEFEVTGNIISQANMVSIGNNAVASGSASFALGSNAEASASSAYAIGNSAKATSNSATALGSGAVAAGSYSVAIGFDAEANGNYSKAIGNKIKVDANGSMFLADNSSGTVHTTVIDNIFNARFANGYKLFTNSGLSIGAQMLAGASSWSVISDSTKKENFKPINGEEVLNKISEFNLRSWNYKGQDLGKFRHYGPMAQEFYRAFGNDGIGSVGNDTTIASADFDGINLIAIQALEVRTRSQEENIKKLEKENQNLISILIKNENLKNELNFIKSEIKALKKQLTYRVSNK